MLIVVSYDVSTTDDGKKRLRKVAKLCQNYGVRVQNSVFECNVDPAQWLMLKTGLLKLYDPDSDSLRFYRLGSNFQGKIEHYGAKKASGVDDAIIL